MKTETENIVENRAGSNTWKRIRTTAHDALKYKKVNKKKTDIMDNGYLKAVFRTLGTIAMLSIIMLSIVGLGAIDNNEVLDDNVSIGEEMDVETIPTTQVESVADSNNEVVGTIKVTNYGGVDRQPAWSADGQWLAFMTKRFGGWNIAKSKIDGTSVVKLPSGLEPSWGPSNRILYSRGISDPTMDVYVVNHDGSGEQRLTNTYGYDEYPDWNSDGSKIAYVSQHGAPNGRKYISVMNADGSNRRNLGIVGIQPSWSPDRTKIAYKCYSGGANICIVNADGSGQRQLTFNRGNNHEPDWSPDGTKVAYASNKDGDWEIYTINVDGTGSKQLTSNTVEDNYPAWSPDGSKIAFSSTRSGNEDIWIMNAN